MLMSSFDVVAVARYKIRDGYCRLVLAGLLPAITGFVAILSSPATCRAQSIAPEIAKFNEKYCTSCHNEVDREGGLDLRALKYAPGDAGSFLAWVKVHDRVQSGEMPPKDVEQPNGTDVAAFVKSLAGSLTAADKQVA